MERQKRTTISLDHLCGGALLERFRLAMRQIASNIMDLNTDPEKARTLTIKITFKPDKSRRSIKTSVATNISLAPPMADETVLLAGKDLRTGSIEICEYGDESQMVQTQEPQLAVVAETMPPRQQAENFDPETGEIYETVTGRQQGPIDLRAGN